MFRVFRVKLPGRADAGLHREAQGERVSDEARPFVNAKLLKQKCLECACEGRHGSLQGEGLKGSWVPASEIEGLWGGGVDGGGGGGGDVTTVLCRLRA